MGIEILLSIQLFATVAGFALVWRRLGRMSDELAQLRRMVDALEARRSPQQRAQRAAPDAVVADVQTTLVPAHARAAHAWGTARDRVASTRLPVISADVRVGATLTAAAVAPALGFLFVSDAATIVAGGIMMAAAMMALALRPQWRAAAWAGPASAAVWALLGFALAATQSSPWLFSASLLIAGAAGCGYALARDMAPGAALALAMGVAALMFAGQTDMAGPAGGAYGGLTLLAALVGAANLRLESFHVAAFAASLAGLFVLSGQDSAALWFTPAAAWSGAVFLAIAAIRAPQLGARGATLAGTGALAPFSAIAVLYGAQHGLADRVAAGGAFAALAAALAGVIALAAHRREYRLPALGVTLWTLAIGAAASAISAIALALPGPLAAIALAAGALLLMMLDARAPHAAWRALACVLCVLSLLYAALNVQFVLAEAPGWPAWTIIAAGCAGPALLAGAAAFQAQRNGAPLAAGLFEFSAIALGIVAADMAARLLFSAGATRLQRVDFAEAGAHVFVWLGASLLIAANARGSAYAARIGASAALGAVALGAIAFASLLWLTPFWSARESAHAAPAGLGFLAPALVLGAHWVFWRARGSNARTRITLAASALLLAAFVTLEISRADGLPDWLAALVGAFSFAGAIVINFAPGVTLSPARRRYLQERTFPA